MENTHLRAELEAANSRANQVIVHENMNANVHGNRITSASINGTVDSTANRQTNNGNDEEDAGSQSAEWCQYNAAPPAKSTPLIPKPKGQVDKEYSLQVKMGLSSIILSCTQCGMLYLSQGLHGRECGC
ncbi:hypothetical protein K435DRAFT_803474 [Dendrothele bispora CBS 962.96]|uniref:Uncharacterized protein n=1 Tax=Dendrothele bispora (strain CBS 962.96) TaxID=1314807 RepID=A0A4S8LHG6_DENBC|nr:hypothetical protein K435DRAFT_803474 [Dendrothele bispora CBS 962.96]